MLLTGPNDKEKAQNSRESVLSVCAITILNSIIRDDLNAEERYGGRKGTRYVDILREDILVRGNHRYKCLRHLSRALRNN